MTDPRDLARGQMPDWSWLKWVRWRYCWWLPLRRELVTAWWDLAAWCNGWCNDSPYAGPEDATRGGYQHWRCTLRTDHLGHHRFNSYVWPHRPGLVRYAPLTTAEHIDQWVKSPYAARHKGCSWPQQMRHMRAAGARR